MRKEKPLSNKKCSKCGQPVKLSFKDRLARGTVSSSARLYPTLKTIVDSAKDYCNECWREVVEPAAKTLLSGKNE